MPPGVPLPLPPVASSDGVPGAPPASLVGLLSGVESMSVGGGVALLPSSSAEPISARLTSGETAPAWMRSTMVTVVLAPGASGPAMVRVARPGPESVQLVSVGLSAKPAGM